MAEVPPTSTDASPCSPLEQEVLDEYAQLLDNLNKVRYSSPSRCRLHSTKGFGEIYIANEAEHCPTSQLSSQLNSLADRPTAEVLDGLRMLERKTSLVCTLLKASVYSIVLQQQIYGGEEGG